RDADSRVANRHLNKSIDRLRPDVDPTTFRRELDGIGKEVQYDLPDLPLVGSDLLQPLIDGHVQRDAPPSGPLTDEGHGVVERHGKTEIREVQLHAASFDLR